MAIEYKCGSYIVDIAIKMKCCVYQCPGPYPCTLHILNFQISNINMVFTSSVWLPTCIYLVPDLLCLSEVHAQTNLWCVDPILTATVSSSNEHLHCRGRPFWLTQYRMETSRSLPACSQSCRPQGPFLASIYSLLQRIVYISRSREICKSIHELRYS